MLPRSTTSPAGSSCNPVGRGEVKSAFFCADAMAQNNKDGTAKQSTRARNIIRWKPDRGQIPCLEWI